MKSAAQLLILVFCLVAASSALSAAGVTDYMNVESPDTGMDEEVENVSSDYKTFTTTKSEETYLTDIFMLRSALDSIKDGFSMLFGLPDMLVNMGLPRWAANFMTAPLPIIIGLLFIYMLSGRDPTK